MADALVSLLLPSGRNPKTNWLLLPLYITFLGTGVAVALPGALLPVLLTRWHLHDQGGGTVFLLAFIGSSLGALLVAGSLLRTVALGSVAIAACSAALSFLPIALAFPCIFLFGLGLGATMTAVSLFVQARSEFAGRAQVRLNLLWSLGASLSPVFALKTLKTGDLSFILYPLAAAFLILGGWTFLNGRSVNHSSRSVITPHTRALGAAVKALRDAIKFIVAVPAPLIVLITLSTGIEASAGGWLATYAKRGGDSFAGVIAAPTCMWTGLSLSRLLWSALPPVRAERRLIQGSLLLTACAALTLLAGPQGWLFFMAAFCFGFGAGPLYPLLLARALKIHASSVIFFMAGVSSAVLPWIMGVLATRSHSLHTGFYVPALASVIMLILSCRAVRVPS